MPNYPFVPVTGRQVAVPLAGSMPQDPVAPGSFGRAARARSRAARVRDLDPHPLNFG